MNRAEKRRQRRLNKKSRRLAAAGGEPTGIAPDIQQALHLAEKHQTAGRFSEAGGICQQILQADPDQPDALHLLGVIAYQVGKHDTAVELITKALAIKPDFAAAHSNLGNALKGLRRLDDAVDSYTKAVLLNPGLAVTHNNLGNTLQELGQSDKAVASYLKALAIKPDYAAAHSNLADTFREMGRLDDAVASCHKALAIKPDYAEAHGNLGAALHGLNRLDEAVASYQKALAINPELAKLESYLGFVLFDLGRLDEAVESYQKAIAINPGHEEAWNNLKFVVKARQFSKADGNGAGEAGAEGLNDAARATVNYVIQQFFLAEFRPHEADESYQKIVAALPSMAAQTIPIIGTDRGKTGFSPLPDKMVALLHFGRSGTGLLHSLIDGHPEISTLPSVYLRGYFNEGVWEKLSADGWQGLPERFADEFAVLFDARTSKPIPSRLGEPPFFIGKNEGMTAVGENRDEFLSLDREVFCSAALRLMEGMERVDPMSFLMVVHGAFEEAIGSTVEAGTNKRLCFYHIHNPDDYAKPNFLRYAPDTRLLMTVREPIQNCESLINGSFKENDYSKISLPLLRMLFDIDQIAFRMRESVGVRLEDMKARPEATMKSLCAWLGVKETPSLYEMTAQGKKWWGDPSSPDYDKDKAMSPFDDATTRRPVGAILGEKDRFVLGTLFYPFSVRFGYRQPDPEQFKKDLDKVRPLINDMLDFEKAMAERSNIDPGQFKKSGHYQLFRAGLVDRWNVLDELGDYPHMLEPLSIT